VNKLNYTVTGLKAGVTYKVEVKAKDRNGNISASSKPIQVKLTDKTAPSTPQNVTISGITGNSFTVNWNASSDNLAVTGYEIYKNGVLIGKTVNRKFAIKGLSTTGVITVSIRAYDAAGNKSANSVAVKTKPTIRVVGKQVYVNFKLLNLGTNGAPVIRNNNFMVAHKPLLEALGFTVRSDAKTKTFTASKRGMTMKFTQSNVVVVLNGKIRKTMSVAPILVNGQWLISANFIAREMGYTVIKK
jgi:chitodextrinase